MVDNNAGFSPVEYKRFKRETYSVAYNHSKNVCGKGKFRSHLKALCAFIWGYKIYSVDIPETKMPKEPGKFRRSFKKIFLWKRKASEVKKADDSQGNVRLPGEIKNKQEGSDTSIKQGKNTIPESLAIQEKEKIHSALAEKPVIKPDASFTDEIQVNTNTEIELSKIQPDYHRGEKEEPDVESEIPASHQNSLDQTMLKPEADVSIVETDSGFGEGEEDRLQDFAGEETESQFDSLATELNGAKSLADELAEDISGSSFSEKAVQSYPVYKDGQWVDLSKEEYDAYQNQLLDDMDDSVEEGTESHLPENMSLPKKSIAVDRHIEEKNKEPSTTEKQSFLLTEPGNVKNLVDRFANIGFQPTLRKYAPLETEIEQGKVIEPRNFREEEDYELRDSIDRLKTEWIDVFGHWKSQKTINENIELELGESKEYALVNENDVMASKRAEEEINLLERDLDQCQVELHRLKKAVPAIEDSIEELTLAILDLEKRLKLSEVELNNNEEKFKGNPDNFFYKKERNRLKKDVADTNKEIYSKNEKLAGEIPALEVNKTMLKQKEEENNRIASSLEEKILMKKQLEGSLDGIKAIRLEYEERRDELNLNKERQRTMDKQLSEVHKSLSRKMNHRIDELKAFLTDNPPSDYRLYCEEQIKSLEQDIIEFEKQLKNERSKG